MQLKTVHVTNFRSAEDSEIFNLEQVTCLVGKNEAGKSAILLALAALNPHESTPAIYDKERDYPRRHLTQYDERHGGQAAQTIMTTWELSDKEVATLSEELGSGVVTSKAVQIWRHYDHGIGVEIELNFKAAVEALYKRFSLDAAERAVLAAAGTTTDLIKLLPTLSSPSAKHTALRTYLDKHGSAKLRAETLVKAMLPKFMYFSSYDRMAGAIQIEQVTQLINNGHIEQDPYRGERLFVEFLEYAGISLDEITSVKTYETFSARLQAASNNITDQILEYWGQNPDLSVDVTIDPARPGDPTPLNSGTVARARINNALHRVNTPFSERSAGFVWFFSFLVKFAQVKDEGVPVVLLLDEPGLTLHGKAQADLLRFFGEKLAPHHQIVYSTHSPFMVPADDLTSVRIVEDQVEVSQGGRRRPIGTKVREDVLSRDPDTLFPLQGALGYEITQSLFVGKNTLLVEGPGDIQYLYALSSALRRRGRTGLDDRWTLCPAGGVDKIRPFVALFVGNALNIAVLSDQAAGDRRKVEDLRRAAVLKTGQFYTMADFLERAEADIEDIFEPEAFAALLNTCYGLSGERALSAATLKAAAPTTERLVKQAEAAFSVMPAEIPDFDHYTPAEWLVRNPKFLDGKSAVITKTLDRAERILATYNRLLN